MRMTHGPLFVPLGTGLEAREPWHRIHRYWAEPRVHWLLTRKKKGSKGPKLVLLTTTKLTTSYKGMVTRGMILSTVFFDHWLWMVRRTWKMGGMAPTLYILGLEHEGHQGEGMVAPRVLLGKALRYQCVRRTHTWCNGHMNRCYPWREQRFETSMDPCVPADGWCVLFLIPIPWTESGRSL